MAERIYKAGWIPDSKVQAVKVYLGTGQREALQAEADRQGLSLSAWLQAIARLLKVEAHLDTPTSKIMGEWRKIVAEMGQK